MSIDDEKHIRGYANLAKFLTDSGFPISKTSLSKIKPEDVPPIAGRWSGAYVYAPSAVLEWANARRNGNKTRKKGGAGEGDAGPGWDHRVAAAAAAGGGDQRAVGTA
jgi:hypothetical protein